MKTHWFPLIFGLVKPLFLGRLTSQNMRLSSTETQTAGPIPRVLRSRAFLPDGRERTKKRAAWFLTASFRSSELKTFPTISTDSSKKIKRLSSSKVFLTLKPHLSHFIYANQLVPHFSQVNSEKLRRKSSIPGPYIYVGPQPWSKQSFQE